MSQDKRGKQYALFGCAGSTGRHTGNTGRDIPPDLFGSDRENGAPFKLIRPLNRAAQRKKARRAYPLNKPALGETGYRPLPAM